VTRLKTVVWNNCGPTYWARRRNGAAGCGANSDGAGVSGAVLRLQVRSSFGLSGRDSGLIYCCFQSVQFLQIKAKIYELQAREAQRG